MELSWEIEVFRRRLAGGGWVEEETLLTEEVRASRVLGRRCKPAEKEDSVGVRGLVRTDEGLWLSEVIGGRLTNGLWGSEFKGVLLDVGQGGGRMEPSLNPGAVLIDFGRGRIEPSLDPPEALLDVGRGRMEPSLDPGAPLLAAVRCDRLPARVSRDVVVEELMLGSLVCSLVGD